MSQMPMNYNPNEAPRQYAGGRVPFNLNSLPGNMPRPNFGQMSGGQFPQMSGGQAPTLKPMPMLTQSQPGFQSGGGQMPFNINSLPAGGQFAGQMSGGQSPQMGGGLSALLGAGQGAAFNPALQQQFSQMTGRDTPTMSAAQPQALMQSRGDGSNAAKGGIAGAIAGLFGDITGSDIGKAAIGAAGLAAVNKAYGDLGDIGDRAYSGAQVAADKSLEQTQFKPFSVTSSTGGQFNVGADGSATMQLGKQEQAIQDALMGDAAQRASQGFSGDANQQAAGGQAYGLGQQFMGQVGQDQTQRRNDIYGNIRAMQSPEEERQRMALEERLFSQGRGGVATNMYGGTPEQLAMAKAQAEAQNQASLMASQQAQAEQLQQAEIGNMYTNLGSQLGARDLATQAAQQQLAMGSLAGAYTPQSQLNALQQGSQMYSQLQQRGQLSGADLYNQSSMGGLSALLGAGQGQANLMGAVGSGLLSGLFK